MNNLLMHDPDLLKTLIDVYFAMCEDDELPPTVPGLVLQIGFPRVVDLTRTLERWDAVTSESEQLYPEQSIIYVLQALTKIEDHYISNGLREKMPAALIKFTLGAYHGVKEPSSNVQSGNTTAIQIVFEQPPQRLTHDAVEAAIMKNPKQIAQDQANSVIEVSVNGN